MHYFNGEVIQLGDVLEWASDGVVTRGMVVRLDIDWALVAIKGPRLFATLTKADIMWKPQQG